MNAVPKLQMVLFADEQKRPSRILVKTFHTVDVRELLKSLRENYPSEWEEVAAMASIYPKPLSRECPALLEFPRAKA